MTPVKTILSASGEVESGAKYSISTPLVMVSVLGFVESSLMTCSSTGELVTIRSNVPSSALSSRLTLIRPR